MWRPSGGEICMVNIGDALINYNNSVLTFAKLKTGEVGICIQDDQNNEPILLAIASGKMCKSLHGESLPNKEFEKIICMIPDKTQVKLHPLKSGKIMVKDKYKLSTGDLVEMIGFEENNSMDGSLTMAVSIESILVNVFRTKKDGVLKSDFLVDFDYELPDEIKDVIYGTYEGPAGLEPNTFAIADATSTTSPGEVIVRVAIDEPMMKIGIIGNALNNKIKTLSIPFLCTNGEIIQPCNPDWNLGVMLLVGLGGDDVLTGVDDPDTKNIIYGDFACGSPPPGHIAGNDDLFGGQGDDIISGEEGDDWIKGLRGNDKLYGNLRQCMFVGLSDDDYIFGGAGDDEIYGDFPDSEETRGGRDVILGMAGNDKIFGGPGDDDLFGESYVWATLPNGDDVLCGGTGRDFLSPGPGHDEIFYKDADHDILQHYPDELYALDLWSQTDCPYWPPE